MKVSTIGKKRHLPWRIAILVTGGLILVGGIGSYIWHKQTKSQLATEEFTELVAREELTVRIRASGKVEPIRSVNVSPKNPGRIVELLVEQGDSVKQGQTLAVMENAEIIAERTQAEARLQQAVANLQQTEVSLQGNIATAKAQLAQAKSQLANSQTSIPKEIAQAEAQLNSAKSRLDLTVARVKRNRYLLEQGAIAPDTLDEAINNNLDAQARVKETQERWQQLQITENLELAQLQARVEEAQVTLKQRQDSYNAEIAALKAEVSANQATLQQRDVRYQDTIVTAPFDGTVTQRYAVAGSFVTPTTSASTSASASATSILALAKGLEIIAKVPEVDIGQLQPRQQVEIVADAFPETVFQGQVKRIAPEAIVEDNVTSFEVRVDLLTGADKLRSKMNVDVTFLGQEISDALVVPTVAIVTNQGETGVMVVNLQEEPEFSPVTIGLTIKDRTQVLDGLTEGDRVYIDLPEDFKRNN